MDGDKNYFVVAMCHYMKKSWCAVKKLCVLMQLNFEAEAFTCSMVVCGSLTVFDRAVLLVEAVRVLLLI